MPTEKITKYRDLPVHGGPTPIVDGLLAGEGNKSWIRADQAREIERAYHALSALLSHVAAPEGKNAPGELEQVYRDLMDGTLVLVRKWFTKEPYCAQDEQAASKAICRALSAPFHVAAPSIEELAKDAEHAQAFALEHGLHSVELKTLAGRIRALPSAIAPSTVEKVVEAIRFIGVKAGVKDTVFGAMCHEVRCILEGK